MKSIISLSLLSSLFLVGCSSSKPVIEEANNEVSHELIEGGMIGGEVSIRLYSKDKSDTVESSIEYMFYETPVFPYHDTVNRIVKEYVAGVVSNGGGRVRQDSEISVEYIEQALDKFANDYNTEISMYDDDFGSVWSTETSIGVYEEKADYVEVSFGNWNYAGGAHGNGSSEQRIIERRTGKELFLADFFSDVEALSAKAEKIFRADQEVPEGTSLQEAGFWFKDGKFKLNENFVFNEESLDFLYNQYEIAPYAAGMIVITIPKEEVKHLLKRKGW